MIAEIRPCGHGPWEGRLLDDRSVPGDTYVLWPGSRGWFQARRERVVSCLRAEARRIDGECADIRRRNQGVERFDPLAPVDSEARG